MPDSVKYPEPPEVAPPVPAQVPDNKADAAWERLLKLRDEARALGIEVDEAWPIQRLIEEITATMPDVSGPRP